MAADYEIRGTTETVDGNGGGTLASPWTVGDRLRITNSGTLRVINGGQVTSSRAYLTDGATVTVTGHGSTWTTSGRTYVATDENNTAIMDIRDGATATTHGVTLGEGVGDKGTLTVTGHGTSWTSTGTRNAYVGYYGEGHLTVSDGASFKSPGLVVGYLPPQFGVIGGTGTVTLTDGGTISIDSGTGTLKLGSGPRTTGTLNIGAAAGDTPAAPGDLNAATVTLGSGSFNLIRGKGLVVFNHNSEDYTFSADIDGIGDVDVYSGVTTYTGTMGSNVTTTLRGGTFILNGSMESATLNGGGLYINGSLGSLTFQSGTLGGNTIPFGFTVPSGSVLAPGNSIGTMTVNGDVTLSNGSTLEVEVDADGNADLLDASGAVTIQSGASLRIKPEDGTASGTPYGYETEYTIVSADGGIVGTFDTVTDSFAFLDPSLRYGATDLILVMTRNNTDFSSLAHTRNQRVAAEGLETIDPSSPVYAAVIVLETGEQARAAYDALSGEVHATAATLLMEDGGLLRDAALNRQRGPSLGAGPVGDGPAGRPDTGVWAQGYGAWGQRSGAGGVAGIDSKTGGILAGVDIPLGDGWWGGAMLGYGHTAFDVDDRASSGDADLFHAGVYGGKGWDGLSLRMGATYSRIALDTERAVRFTGFSETLTADRGADLGQTFVELGQTIPVGRGAIEPFGTVAMAVLRTGGFSEDGGDAALSSDGDVEVRGFSTLGVAGETSFDVGGLDVTVNGRLGWRHLYGSGAPTADLHLSGGDDFAVEGVDFARDSLVANLGLTVALGAQSEMSVSYSGNHASGSHDHGGSLRLVGRF